MSVNDRDERETAYSVHFKDIFAAINIIVPSDHEKHVYVSRQTAHTQKKAAAPSAQANFVCAETNTLLFTDADQKDATKDDTAMYLSSTL